MAMAFPFMQPWRHGQAPHLPRRQPEMRQQHMAERVARRLRRTGAAERGIRRQQSGKKLTKPSGPYAGIDQQRSPTPSELPHHRQDRLFQRLGRGGP